MSVLGAHVPVSVWTPATLALGVAVSLLLWRPVAYSVVLATRRVLAGVAVAVLLPLVVEVAQSQLPRWVCSASDLLTNGTGALFGVALGGFIERRVARRPRPDSQGRDGLSARRWA